MKLMFASDIHGCAPSCELMLKRFDEEKAGLLFLLGDILYHGPRNDPPEGYDPKAVTRMLNERKDILFCVRGNCDTEVDQMVLAFPILADYAVLDIGAAMIYLTHGHKFNESNLPPLKTCDILMNGHTHVPKCINHETYTYINPGSVSIPKENSKNSYMTLERGVFLWKDVCTGEEYDLFEI